MKTALVCAFDTYFDRVALLKEYYESRGDTVTVYSSDFSHRSKKQMSSHPLVDVMVPAMPYHKNLSVARLRSHYRFSKDVSRLADMEGFDLVHVIVPCNSLVKWYGLLKKKKPSVKLVFDIVDLWPETMPVGRIKTLFPFTLWKNLRDHGLDRADVIFTECKLFTQVLQRTRDPKTHVLYWARKEKPQPVLPQLPEDVLQFCYLGSINHIIDIDFIVSFLSECQKYKPVVLHLIGNGESKEELLSRLKEKNIPAEDHHEVYDREKKQKIFDCCHYGLNVMKTNVVVGLTMKSLDYMCAGLPMINTIGGDTQEFCEERNIGYHVTPDTIADAAKKVCMASKDENLEQRYHIQSLYREFFTEGSFFKTLEESL